MTIPRIIALISVLASAGIVHSQLSIRAPSPTWAVQGGSGPSVRDFAVRNGFPWNPWYRPFSADAAMAENAQVPEQPETTTIEDFEDPTEGLDEFLESMLSDSMPDILEIDHGVSFGENPIQITDGGSDVQGNSDGVINLSNVIANNVKNSFSRTPVIISDGTSDLQVDSDGVVNLSNVIAENAKIEHELMFGDAFKQIPRAPQAVASMSVVNISPENIRQRVLSRLQHSQTPTGQPALLFPRRTNPNSQRTVTRRPSIRNRFFQRTRTNRNNNNFIVSDIHSSVTNRHRTFSGRSDNRNLQGAIQKLIRNVLTGKISTFDKTSRGTRPQNSNHHRIIIKEGPLINEQQENAIQFPMNPDGNGPTVRERIHLIHTEVETPNNANKGQGGNRISNFLEQNRPPRNEILNRFQNEASLQTGGVDASGDTPGLTRQQTHTNRIINNGQIAGVQVAPQLFEQSQTVRSRARNNGRSLRMFPNGPFRLSPWFRGERSEGENFSFRPGTRFRTPFFS